MELVSQLLQPSSGLQWDLTNGVRLLLFDFCWIGLFLDLSLQRRTHSLPVPRREKQDADTIDQIRKALFAHRDIDSALIEGNKFEWQASGSLVKLNLIFSKDGQALRWEVNVRLLQLVGERRFGVTTS